MNSNSYWVGLSDTTKEGTYVWESGRELNINKWNSGEPNNSGNEDCVHFTKEHNGGLKDVQCHIKSEVVCQKGKKYKKLFTL